jgi:hypothetical protein
MLHIITESLQEQRWILENMTVVEFLFEFQFRSDLSNYNKLKEMVV